MIDSGTSLIVLPGDMAEWSVLNTLATDCSNMMDLPSISFYLEQQRYTLEPADYVLRRKLNGVLNCQLGLEKNDKCASYQGLGCIPLLGQVFIRKYYTTFDTRNG